MRKLENITDDQILNPDFKLVVFFLGKERELERINERQKAYITKYMTEYGLIYRTYDIEKSEEVENEVKKFLKTIFKDVTDKELEGLSRVDLERLNKEVDYYDNIARGMTPEQIERMRTANIEGIVQGAEKAASDPDFMRRVMTQTSPDVQQSEVDKSESSGTESTSSDTKKKK